MVEDESVNLGGMNSISPDLVNHDHTCQSFSLENDFCDIALVQDSTFEDIMTCSGSKKPSGLQMIWSVLSDRLSYVVENMPTCITYTPQQYHLKRWKAKQALYDASNCNNSCRDNNYKNYGIQHGLKNDFEPHVHL